MSAPGTSVLFDAPGPRTRRRTLIATVVALALLAAVLVAVVLRFAERGQLDAELWGPLVDPTTEEFPLVWRRLGSGLLVTLQAAAAAMVASLVIGVLFATTRLMLGRYSRMPLVAVIELLRGLPVIVTILYVSVLLPVLGLELSDFWYLVIGLTAYNSVIISEIVRAGIVSLPKGQVEAGLAVGLTRGQTMRLVQLPQAFRSMLPALISQLVVILKDTALASFVLNGVDDLIRESGQMRIVLGNPLQMFLVVAVIYIVLCLLLDRLAHWVQRRSSRTTTAATPDPTPAADAVTRT